MDANERAGRDLDEFDEDLVYQRRFWKLERIAWVGYALVLAIALAGLTGAGGPLSHATVRTPYGDIEYPRVARWQTTDTMIVRFSPASGDTAELMVAQRFLDTFEIKSIQPAPVSAVATGDGVRYAFDIESGGTIAFMISAHNPALFPDATIRIGEAEASVRALILP